MIVGLKIQGIHLQLAGVLRLRAAVIEVDAQVLAAGIEIALAVGHGDAAAVDVKSADGQIDNGLQS